MKRNHYRIYANKTTFRLTATGFIFASSFQTFKRCWRLVLLLIGSARASRSILRERPVSSLLLEQHNVFRQEERAANIYQMRWNESLASAAERWAAGCDFKHEVKGRMGENLFFDTRKGDDVEMLMTGLEAWHDEKRAWRYTNAACGPACHYTQMVWASTTSVGCSYKRCPVLTVGSRTVNSALYLVCFYYPRGNYIGQFPYKLGAPCSGCGSNVCRDGLCLDEIGQWQQTEDYSKPQELVWQSFQRRSHHQSHHVSHSSAHRTLEIRDGSAVSFTSGQSEHRAAELRSFSQSEHRYDSAGVSQQYSQSHQESREQQQQQSWMQQNDAITISRDKSPLEILREHTHWCRDRLPSCRTWTHKCTESKAVYVSCPRSCGHCDKDTTTTVNQTLESRHYQQLYEYENIHKAHQQNQHQQQQQLQREHQQSFVEQHRKQAADIVLEEEKNIKRHQKKAEKHQQRLQRRRQRQQERQQKEYERRRKQAEKDRKGQGLQRHLKFKTSDRRAENLAEELRRDASNGSCEDDAKYIVTCPYWVSQGFCTGNELVANVYCKKSCRKCSAGS